MTLIINCRFLTQDLTGVQRFAEEITKRLVEEERDIELVAPRGDLRRMELGGSPVQQIGRLSGHAWEQIELARYVRRRGGSLLSLANTGPVLTRRQFLVIHDLTWLLFPKSYSWKFRLVYRVLTSLLVRRVQGLGTVSDFSRQDIARHFRISPERIAVIPNAVDERFRTAKGVRPSGLPEGEFFLSVSSLNKHKNVGVLVQAFRQFRQTTQSNVKLVLVGGSSGAFAADDELSAVRGDGVVALGRVTDDELIWLYRQGCAFVFPSLYEGFGIPPLEAQAAGCPVVSSSAASLPEVLQNSALLFDPAQESAILEALQTVAHDSALRRELTTRGARNVQRFNWRRSGEKVHRLLKSLESYEVRS